jgi:predicted type IV restriction endonuclease
LLQALGWNTQDRNEVGLEEKISGGRVHYSHESCQVQCSKRGALV